MNLSRKTFLRGSGGFACASLLGRTAAAQELEDKSTVPWRFFYSLNTGTIRGQKLGLAGEIDVAVRAGYDAIEPWTGTISEYSKSGGSLVDIRKRCDDAGLKVCSAIGFANWIVDDPLLRAEGVEQMKREMDTLARIGGTHIAAPPAGANRPGSRLDLDAVAERYRVILEAGRNIGVIPQVETWGSSANLSHVAEAVYVAAKSGDPDACVLSDVYHMYKGGVEAAAAKLLGRGITHCFHMNDYPADPPREAINDSHRVWPGDGIAPIGEILGYMAANHCRVYLSLELFNKSYWELDALDAARTGLSKMKACVTALG